MDFKDRIKTWRKHLGWSQAAFCDATSIPLRTQKGYEAGTRAPGSEALASIAKTGVNINWLLTGEGPMQSLQETELPDDLLKFQSDFNEILEMLLAIDPDKRETAVNEMLSRVKDAARMNELERLVQKLKKD